MDTSKLSKMEFAELAKNLRIIRDALENLIEVEDGLIEEQSIDQIRDAFSAIENEFIDRGYSQKEIADFS